MSPNHPGAQSPNPPPNAFWIGSDHPFDLHEAYLRFRSPPGWTLPGRPASAQLFLTGDSRYKLWINGRFVARGPTRSWPHAQQVDVLDVAEHLRAGPNRLAVQVYQPGYSHFAYQHRGAAGLLAWLLVDGRPTLVTDTSWRTRRDPSFQERVHRVSIYGSGVEERNLALAEPWTEPGFDDSAWAPARIVAPVGGIPWTGLRLRSTPFLVERTTALPASPGPEGGPFRLVALRQGPALGDPRDPHALLRRSWEAGRPVEAPSQDGPGWWAPQLGAGEALTWLFDLGRAFTCQGWVEVRGAGGQEQLLVSYADKGEGGDVVLSDPNTYCRVRMTDRFFLRAGAQRAQGFSPRGGRFLLFQLLGPTGPRLRLGFRVTTGEYPLAVTKPLELSDPLLDGVVRLCETTARACLQETFVDCVWREATQWLGDALPQALTLSAMGDDLRPLRLAIQMAGDGAYPDGLLPSVLPGEAHAYAVLDYNFTWVELLGLHHRLRGDGKFLARMWPVLARMLARFRQDVAEDGLLRSQPGRRLFLDWAPLSREEPSAVYNLRYLQALQLAAGDWEEMGAGWRASVASQQAEWRAEAKALERAIRRAFWEGGTWWDDRDRTTFSQLATALALLTGLVRDGEQDALLDALAARSLDLRDAHRPGQMVLASPFMHHYVLEALFQGRRYREMVAIIRSRWGRWVQGGYPTTWENWNVDFPDGSQCHAFSAHPRYHLARLVREVGWPLPE